MKRMRLITIAPALVLTSTLAFSPALGYAQSTSSSSANSKSTTPPSPKPDAYRRGVEGAQQKGAAIKAANAEETRRHNSRVDQPTTTNSPSTGAGENKKTDPRAVTNRDRKP